MSPEPLISLVVPTYQRCASVDRLIKALIHQTLAPEQYEVIIVIDGSTDSTRELIDHAITPFSLKSIWQTNQGRAAACNRGICTAKGSLIVLLDDDMEPSPYLLEAHWNAHQDNPRLGVLGAVPIRLDPSSPPVMQYIGAKFNQHLEKLAQAGYTLKLRDFYSGNFSIQRTVLMEVGLFDEKYRIYGNEDLDLSWRLSQASIRLVYCQDALAIQHYEKNFPALARDNIAKGKTSILLANLHPDVFPETKLSTYSQESKNGA